MEYSYHLPELGFGYRIQPPYLLPEIRVLRGMCLNISCATNNPIITIGLLLVGSNFGFLKVKLFNMFALECTRHLHNEVSHIVGQANMRLELLVGTFTMIFLLCQFPN